MRQGADRLYAALDDPREGTILTVARETAAAAERIARETGDISLFMRRILAEGQVALYRGEGASFLPRLQEHWPRFERAYQLRVRNNPLASLPAGFATMRATIDITGTKIDPAKLSPELRARIGTEKPPGSKEPDKIIVAKPEKEKKR